MKLFVFWFYKITSWPIITFFYRPKIYIQNEIRRKPNVKGTIIIANHYDVYDVPFIINTFFFKKIYFISGEALYKKRLLSWWLAVLGGIKVDRTRKDVDWIEKSEKLLRKGKSILIFPEAKLSPNNDLEFKETFAVLASRTKAPVLSLYVSGDYSFKNRAGMVIGKKIDIDTLWDIDKNYRENIKDITKYFRNYNKELQLVYESKQKK